MEAVSSLNFDIFPNEINAEEHDEEDEEEEKQREKELQELLTTAFDDLTDDEGDCGDKSGISEANPQSQQLKHDWPAEAGLVYETSTPHNERPPWTANFTPITGNARENCHLYASMPNGCLSPVEEGDSVQENQNNRIGDLPEDNLYPSRESNFHLGNNHDDPDAQPWQGRTASEINYQQVYADELASVKGDVERWKEEGEAKIRLLKHQLTLVEGEKEGLAFSLQQAQQLIIDKDQDIATLHSKLQTVEDELNKDKSTNNELRQKLEVSESLIASLQEQVKELGSYKKLTNVQESQERLIHFLKEKHQKEVLSLKEKTVQMSEELERTQGQLKFLEQYFQQTIPDRMAAISRLCQNLESVQNNCEQLLGTDAMRDVEKLTLQQNEREKLQQLNNEKIQTLVVALSDLGSKISQVQNTETIPLAIHSKLLNEMEKEKNEFETALKNVNNRLHNLEDANQKLISENTKLNNEMEAIMKKHENLMTSAIEKYHSLHKIEISNSRQELLNKFEEEKSNLCTFYEQKIADQLSEMNDLTNSLSEVKEMYLKVCTERNDFENLLQKLNEEKKFVAQEFDMRLRHDVERRLNEAKLSWDQAAVKQFSVEYSKAQKKWDVNQSSALRNAMQLIGEMFKSSAILFIKEKEKICEKMDALQRKFLVLQQTFNLQLHLSWENKEKLLRENILQEHNLALANAREDVDKQWKGKMLQVEDLFRRKINEMQVAQQNDLDNIMSEVRKAMLVEKERLLNEHRENALLLKQEISRLEKDILLARMSQPQKQDVAVSCTLNSTNGDNLQHTLMMSNKELENQVQKLHKEREALLQHYRKVVNSLQRLQGREEKLKKLSLCRNCEEPISERISKSIQTNGLQFSKAINRNVCIQTEKDLGGISRVRVKELIKAYSDVLRELAAEVSQQLSTTSVQQSERLRLFILQHYNNEAKNA